VLVQTPVHVGKKRTLGFLDASDNIVEYLSNVWCAISVIFEVNTGAVSHFENL